MMRYMQHLLWRLKKAWWAIRYGREAPPIKDRRPWSKRP